LQRVKKDMPQLSIYVPDDLYVKLMKENRSELIQKLLNEYYAKEEKHAKR
jgi:metal-responsive CopG/Arc/MetJ family transcriptional regulator